MNTDEFKTIPFFSNYSINKDGVVINRANNDKIMTPKWNGYSFRIQMLSDRGDRTTRTVPVLIELVWWPDGCESK